MKRIGAAAYLVSLFHGASGGAQTAPPLEPKALQEMVETERAFAAMGAEKGVRESFFQYFGEEGISFDPHPHRFREKARRNPPPEPPPPLEFRLEWWPVYGDVAESGDLGYNTGPTLVTDLTSRNRPARHGYFFSVWKRQPDGTWKVAVDMGSSTPGVDADHQDRLRYERAPPEAPKTVLPASASAGRDELLALEAGLAGRARDNGLYASYARLHRPEQFPIRGRRAIEEFIASRDLVRTKSEGLDGGVAASGELGYTYGRYKIQLTDSGGERKSEAGYFTHVWKRDREGAWKLVAEVMSPLPPE